MNIDLKKITLGQVISSITGLLSQIVSIVLIAIIASSVWQAAVGWPLPFIRPVDHVSLAYLCGSYWLFRK